MVFLDKTVQIVKRSSTQKILVSSFKGTKSIHFSKTSLHFSIQLRIVLNNNNNNEQLY